MTGRVSLTDLRQRAERMNGGQVYELPDGTTGIRYGYVSSSDVLALVDAVEAAHALVDRSTTDLREIGRRELRLLVALSRFTGYPNNPDDTEGAEA